MVQNKNIKKNINEKLILLSNTKDLNEEREVSSHRKVIGPLLVKVRNKIKEEVDLTINPIIKEQVNFNNNVFKVIQLLNSKNKMIGKNLKENKKEIKKIRKENSPPQIDYLGFEEEYRGSQRIIKNNLKRFIDFFLDKKRVVDIGCGRGEFLELLKSKGINAEGIDIDNDMVEVCKNKGLKIKKLDAVSFLEKQKDNSLGGIFSSQVIEHMKPSYLHEFIKLSFKKLKKDSFFVAETLNPQSFYAFSHHYLTDLSHMVPLHFETMKFLLKSVGFKDVKIEFRGEVPKEERLKEVDDKLMNENVKKLNKLLYGWQDYAVIGKKV